MSDANTNFSGYSHGDLRRMVQSMDSGGVMAASDPWRKAATTLKQIRAALNTAAGDATGSWEGATSNAFYSKMTTLANSVNNVAAYANDAAITLQGISEAIDQAKRDMPEEPDLLDKVGDSIGDAAKSMVGEKTTPIADERKAQAVAVMDMLALKYRASTAGLQVPKASSIEEVEKLPPPGDSSGAEAISGLIVGAGLGLASAGGDTETSHASSRPSASWSGQTAQPPKPVVVAPTDPGVWGGTATPAPRPQHPGSVGPGTGIDGGVTVPKTGGVGRGPITAGGGTGGTATGALPGTGGCSGVVGGGGLAGGAKGGSASGGLASGRGGLGSDGSRGAVRGGGAFGAGGMGGVEGEAGGVGGGSRSGRGLGQRPGGVVGEAGSGGAGRRSFTEGGSGIGRSRAQAGQSGTGGGAHGGMPGAAGKGSKKEKKGKERPDYLVEDEETWMSGEKANPNVVE
ncbi:WXG100 family type VII secretion target [Saccharothrix sp. ST-888]|uniref:WXG100 family type VII secretion target n=1 Tax=Saccharothrix sp. ST-888 TaxID=1427391 RepID=UPI0009E5E5AE|nr:WXG100 family type VII secretion target [Saccharothrix sp. ST-888]